MNGFIGKPMLFGLVLASCPAWGAGCYTYRDLVDPCYPQRYEAESRKVVYGSLTPQVNNGHVLDQTVWNYDFEPGTDKITPGGIQRLAYLVRRRPAADPVVYVQIAQDVPMDSTNVSKSVDERAKLDYKRVDAVRRTLAGLSGNRNQVFDVLLHDPHEVGQAANMASRTVMLRDASAVGALPSSAGSAAGGAGAPGGGGGGGGAPGGGR
jgi:hypothetical protein